MFGAITALAVAFCALPKPASAFEIFGFELFGGNDDAAEVEVLDPLDYTVRFRVRGGDDDLSKTLRQSSALWTERRQPAPGSSGLIALARGDYRSILAALYAEGLYSGTINIRLNGREAGLLDLTTTLKGPVSVDVLVDPGPPFRFGDVSIRNAPPGGIEGDPPLLVRNTPARAGEVSAAGDRAVAGWRALGYPVARVAGRDVVADHATRRLDVAIGMDPGPQARVAEVRVENSGRVDPLFVRYLADIPEGSVFDPEAIERATNRLNRLGVFRAVRITEPDTVSADGTIPLTVETVPRKRRRYGIGATLSSIEGMGLQGFWLHRNLLGRAERLRFDAEISGIGAESEVENYDYFLGVSFTKPGVFTPDTNFETGASVSQSVFDDYRERKVQARAGFSRIFTDSLIGNAFFDIAVSEVEDDDGTETYYTVSAPVSLTFDRRDDPLDPKGGYYLDGLIQPFHELEFGSTGIRGILEGRTYFPLGGEDTILALRGRLSSITGGNREELPPSLLFFTGGGGSVRGYGFRSNGLEVDGETVGGRSSLELSAEVRRQIFGNFSAAAFVDAGLVSADVIPSSENDIKVGVGGGIRYKTGLGPIRFDIARPLDPGPDDPSIAFYFGIGQAF